MTKKEKLTIFLEKWHKELYPLYSKEKITDTTIIGISQDTVGLLHSYFSETIEDRILRNDLIDALEITYDKDTDSIKIFNEEKLDKILNS